MPVFAGNMNDSVAATLGAYLLRTLIWLAVQITVYVLSSKSLYDIARRRDIDHPWLAWLPVGNVWILGSISDDYQYVAKDRSHSRRKIMLGLNIAVLVVGLINLAINAGSLISLLSQSSSVAYMGYEQLLELVLSKVLRMAVFLLITGILRLILAIFRFICLYDLYESCDPDHKVLFLILSIPAELLQSILLFVCRNKDEGMPVKQLTGGSGTGSGFNFGF